MPLAFGTDWFVEPLDPRLGLYAAVTREFPEGGPAGGFQPQEKITLEQALDAYTRGSAYAEFAEADKGTLRPASWPTSWSSRRTCSGSRRARS